VARRRGRRRRGWPLLWCRRRRLAAGTTTAATLASAAVLAAGKGRPLRRRQAARLPLLHPRGGAVARPRRRRRRRRRRTTADGDTKSALGGGAALTRRAAGGGGNDDFIGGGAACEDCRWVGGCLTLRGCALGQMFRGRSLFFNARTGSIGARTPAQSRGTCALCCHPALSLTVSTKQALNLGSLLYDHTKTKREAGGGASTGKGGEGARGGNCGVGKGGGRWGGRRKTWFRADACDGGRDGHSQRRLGPAPIYSFSQRLWPVFLRLSLDPYKTRSIFRRLRRYRPCLPQSPSDSG